MSRQSGFGTIELGLILVIITLIAGVGWFVWHSQQQTTKTLDSTVQGQGQTTKSSSKRPLNKTTTYIEIKEWNVRAPYTGSLTLSYTIENNGSAYFSAKQMDDLVASTDVSCKGFAGAITRYRSDEHLNGDDSLPTAANADSSYGLVHVGNYYYLFAHAQAFCSGSLPFTTVADTKTAQLESLLTQANNDVKALTAALQPVP